MGILQTMPDLRWTVNCSNASNHFRWLYIFEANGTVRWLDENSGSDGAGSWSIKAGKLITQWRNSATVETWDMPIDTTQWTGTCVMKGEKYTLQATARNYSRYVETAAEGQQDPMACWAASLAWLSKVITATQVKSQDAIFKETAGSFLGSGAISKQGLMTVSLAGLNLRRKRVQAGQLDAIVKSKPFPMFIGFASGPLGGHVNVLHAYDQETQTVDVMEPWYPDPSRDPNYELSNAGGMPLFAHKKTGAPFVFRGTHLKRPLSYYTSRPLGGEFIIGYSAEIQEPASR